MSCETQVELAPPPAGLCFPQPWYNWLRSSIKIVLAGCGFGVKVIRSVSAPSIDDSNATWERVSTQGCPLGDFIYYNGEWRKKPTFGIGHKMFYDGPIEGVFDPSTWIGLHGGQMDGWKIVKDPDQINRFLVAATGYNAGTGFWESTVDGVAAPMGGGSTHLLTLAETPRPARVPVTARGWKADGNGPTTLNLYGGGPTGTEIELLAGDTGNANPTPFSILPPWRANALVEYIGICL